MSKPSLEANNQKLIHKYIDRLCNKMNESPQEVNEFREEMINNLMSSVKYWKSKGLGESEAVSKALNSFGEPQEIETELKTLYRIKKVFSGNILKSSIAMLFLGIIIVGWFLYWNELRHYDVADEAFEIVLQEVGTAENPISDTMIKELEQYINKSTSVSGVVLRIQEDTGIAPQDYPIQYKYPENLKLDKLNNIPNNEYIFTYIVPSGTNILIPGTNKAISIDVGIHLFNDTTFMIGIILLFGYWILFAVWASMNVYYKGHGRALLVVLFLLLNVVGYALYLLGVKLIGGSTVIWKHRLT
ncbi:permease prefix domain 1-containing protein [Paenibacillus endoradicis]|uniref:permease prefix domain 1-containing protein n=1 Tax=Paenibacillus endoradicis TaxID=2972487 RepID=UPI0021599AF6|nr:permease prefix domain 1-containing protein [Paenibacillus endoradicis]MCR8656080.1 permease prefix domain 1-containing protein [Paenibacillus endoradicis]MCR8658406.1 permease prefix domain 1-containing protein [Paenibacillus endoradicis]